MSDVHVLGPVLFFIRRKCEKDKDWSYKLQRKRWLLNSISSFTIMPH